MQRPDGTTTVYTDPDTDEGLRRLGLCWSTLWCVVFVLLAVVLLGSSRSEMVT